MTDPLDALHRALDDYPRQLAEATDRAAAAAATTITTRDESGQVTVTASGNGDIQGVRVTARALHQWDPHQLAAALTTAVNAALARAEATLEEATTTLSTDAEARAEARLRSFEQKMDATLDRLDHLTRNLDRLLDE
ncbi:YbaB/EbfC family nucleoid-associated protein [Actinoplanes philippinensis]|uniref:YbaB/EbfC family nucleoid-associated protein n=1 Tax=Actinoplanes philippinensis TaxID=35752 RepID=UPI00340E8345